MESRGELLGVCAHVKTITACAIRSVQKNSMCYEDIGDDNGRASDIDSLAS